MPSHNEISYKQLVSYMLDSNVFVLRQTPVNEAMFETTHDPDDVQIDFEGISIGFDAYIKRSDEPFKVYNNRHILLSDVLSLELKTLHTMEIK